MVNKSKKIEKKETEKVEPVVVESPLKTGMSDKTRGIIIGAVVTALIAGLVILLALGANGGKGNSNNLVDPSDYSAAMKEFYDYFESEEKTLIVFASSQCGYCVAQEPIVEALAKEYGINYLYMDYLKLGSNEEIDQVMAELELKKGSTPTSVVVQNGKVIDTWVGYVDGEEYLNHLIDAGVVKKGTKYTLETNIEAVDYSKFKKLLKGSKVSAIIVDMPTCAVCYEARVAVNKLAKKHNFKVYQLSAEVLSQEEMDKFIDGLGTWGYDAEEYKKDKSVAVPLILFVKNGKIVRYETGYSEETDLEGLFKKAGLID